MKPHEILEISPRASREQITEAYRVMLKRYHPDYYHGPEKDYFTQKTQLINDAYRQLIGGSTGTEKKESKKTERDYLEYLKGKMSDLTSMVTSIEDEGRADEALVERLHGMADTFEGILDVVFKSRRYTPRQLQALDNIFSAVVRIHERFGS